MQPIIKIVAAYLEGLMSADEAMNRVAETTMEIDGLGVSELCKAIERGENIFHE